MKRAATVALLAAALLAGCSNARDATDGQPVVSGAKDGDTRAVTLHDDGTGRLRRGPGAPLRTRTALAPAAREGAVLATIGQLTDTHVRDEESPARVAFLDRLGGPFQSVFRPQEALTTQALAAGVRAIDAARPNLTVLTGDVIDNAQDDELRQAIAVLKGGRVDPDTGAPGYSGIQSADDPDPSYYRPDVDPPRFAGLLDAAQRPFVSPGLTGKVAAIPGNHDILRAGEILPTPQTERIAVGDRRLVQPDRDLRVPRDEALASGAVSRLLAGGRLPGRTAYTPPDPDRRADSVAQWLARMRAAGFDEGSGDRADTTIDIGPRVRVVTLDVTRRAGLDEGAVVAGQAQFLAAALKTDRWVLVVSHEPLRKTVGGAQLTALLDRSPRVVAAVAGDTHKDRITPHPTPAGGWWDITTTALADWPQQGRILQLRATAGGGVALDTWKVDTAPSRLADISRALALLDAQGGRPGDNAGTALDRNVRLFKRATPARRGT